MPARWCAMVRLSLAPVHALMASDPTLGSCISRSSPGGAAARVFAVTYKPAWRSWLHASQCTRRRRRVTSSCVRLGGVDNVALAITIWAGARAACRACAAAQVRARRAVAGTTPSAPHQIYAVSYFACIRATDTAATAAAAAVASVSRQASAAREFAPPPRLGARRSHARGPAPPRVSQLLRPPHRTAQSRSMRKCRSRDLSRRLHRQ